ncbi:MULTISPECIES: type II toxin-antitoxin system HicB family antitoxin [unclassified Thalassospira]|uniref:type II toxin-antitoxin system HicB family antitoxin n=1 Tax=unclassified Thalassospira TaxID=2648997 RepID=UPI001B09A748|nr:type II toxin-antitoxin system HicB family antitoxin [Thalassospira sp.]MBO6772890.1 type II toxin-antitoxin system HicB family antitoxin [Thalassospira sp.]
MKQTYWGLVHTDDDGGFGISFPDFPGCVSAADTMTELVELGTEALNFHIEGMHEDGEDIPAPSPVVELDDGAVGIVAITATIPGKKRRINLTLDANLIDLIEAKYGKRAVSSFLEEAGRKAL